MTGYVQSQGLKVSERKVSHHLRELRPADYERRRNRVHVSNPIPYRADYFGEKLHIDQNEKLLMFGVFHAACIDGYSGKIVRHIICPQKNNVLLYEQLYCPIIRDEGMWTNLRVDYGTEWNLILFVQSYLQQHRLKTDKPPYTQSFSKQNLRIERWWVEVNKRVNYPIKLLLGQMQEDAELPQDNPNDKFIIGEFVRRTATVGVDRLVAAWNNHRIDKKGIPNQAGGPLGQVPANTIPLPDAAVMMYERGGGNITLPGQAKSISDPTLWDMRDDHFFGTVGTFSSIFEMALVENRIGFANALQHYLAATKNYQPVI